MIRTCAATQVRDAADADAPAIAAIGKTVVPDTYRMLCDPAVIRGIVEQSYAVDALRACIDHCAATAGAHFLVAQSDSRLVGFLHYDSDGAEPELHRIYVELDRKRQGIGGALLQELHRRLPAATSYILMAVADNHAAVAFYHHHTLTEDARVDGVAYMHEHMGVDFPAGTPSVPALLLRFTKEA